MYTRILVPLDGSDVAEGALAHAAQMADIFDAELILLRVVFLAELPGLDLGEAQRFLVKESEAYLRNGPSGPGPLKALHHLHPISWHLQISRWKW